MDNGWVRPARDAEPQSSLRDVLRLAALARPALARRLGISVSEVWAVEHLMAEPMGPVELSRRLDMTSAAATVLVRRLEATGHVVREPHPADRRRTVLRPTPAAAGAVLEELRPFLAELDAAADALDDDGRRAVTGYLAAVRAALDRLVSGEHRA
jgi:DNA-binding MarR family transcriptional regulator